MISHDKKTAKKPETMMTVSAQVDRPVWRQVRLIAAAQDLNQSDIVRKAVLTYLAAYGGSWEGHGK